MSWGIDFTADIFLPRQNYGENVYAVQEEIDSLVRQNQGLKERMMMMVTGGVSSVYTKDMDDNECDPVDILHTKFSDLLAMFDENNTRIIDLGYYKQYLENRGKDECKKEGEENEEYSQPEQSELEENIQRFIKDYGGFESCFRIRVRNVLEMAKITNIRELLECSVDDLRGCRNFGNKCLIEVREILAEYGLYLRGDKQFCDEHLKWKYKNAIR